MKYSDIKTSILSQFAEPQGNKTVFYIEGAPGGGKSACARDAFHELGFSLSDNMVQMNASTHEPVDVNGIPITSGDFSHWLPPEEFYRMRAGVGRFALLLEELPDAPIAMQNALCAPILDRIAGQLQLTNELFIIATGNRTKDKSGANRMTSKLAGRVRRLEFTEDMKEICAYAMSQGWHEDVVAFFHFRPGLISDFDPNRFANPTPRTWEDVMRISPTLREDLYLENVAGAIGEGAASEYVGFKKIYKGLPSISSILKAPTTATVPKDPATKYALMGAIANQTTKDNIDAVVTYTDRFDPEHSVMAMWVIVRRLPEVMNTSAFTRWASKHSEVLL